MRPKVKREWIFHIEFIVVVILLGSILLVGLSKEIPVSVEVDAAVLQEANTELTSEISNLISLQEMYHLSLEELRLLAACGGLDRLSSEQAVVGRSFYVGDELFFYYVSLKEYSEAKFNVMIISPASEINKSYIRPLTADIEFLARQFTQRYPDKTERAMAILALVQNLKIDEHESDRIRHPTVTLMRGGVCIDFVIACGALLKAAGIDCAILVFKSQQHAAIGIPDIDSEKIQMGASEAVIIKYKDQQYLVCGLSCPVGEASVSSIIPYEFP